MSQSSQIQNIGSINRNNGDDENRRIMEATASINAILQGLSNKEAKEVLTMASSIRNLRVVSMDRPIGLNIQKSAPPVGSNRQPSRARPKKAEWKNNPEWVAAEAEHSRLISLLKSSSSFNKDEIIGQLRQHEANMKLLRQQLGGCQERA